MISRVALPKKSDSECAAIDHVQSGGTWTSAVERTRASCKRAQNVRFVIFYPKRSLPIHPSFEMHYVYKEEKKRRTYEMIPTGVQTRWGPRPNGAILNCRNIHSYPFQQSTQLNNYSERRALEERKWLAVISSFIMQNAIFRQLTIVCCLRICLSAWKSQEISFVLGVKAHNVTVSHSLDKRNLSSPFCASRLHEDDHNSVKIATW